MKSDQLKPSTQAIATFFPLILKAVFLLKSAEKYQIPLNVWKILKALLPHSVLI